MENYLFWSFQNQKQPEKRNKKRLTEHQVSILEKSFACKTKLEAEQKLQLSKQLGVPPRQVAIWYQNKRARCKAQSLEEDHGALQLKLQNVMAEKKQLERDIANLKAELKEAKDMLLFMKAEEGGGLHNNNHASFPEFSYGSEEFMEVQELYTCFMPPNKFV